MKFRKKPVVIEAYRIPLKGKVSETVPAWLLDAIIGGSVKADHATGLLYIPTLEGEMAGNPGDWIIKGVKGELYPCKPDIFEASYVPETEGDANGS